jgi:hypothetical protein
VADLKPVAQSKRAAPKRATRQQKLAALKKESDRALVAMIHRLLDKPIQERTHFLRKRTGIRASAL